MLLMTPIKTILKKIDTQYTNDNYQTLMVKFCQMTPIDLTIEFQDSLLL